MADDIASYELSNDQLIEEQALIDDIIKPTDNEASLLRKQYRAAGIYQPEDMKYKERFYRTRRMDPYYTVDGTTFEYVFFTKPDLNLLDDNGNLNSYIYKDSNVYGIGNSELTGGAIRSPYLNELANNGYWKTFADLCYSRRTVLGRTVSRCPFIRILTNRKLSNLDIPELVVNEVETPQNLFGSKMYYPLSSITSDEEAEFNIEFAETQYLEIYHLFKAYDTYRRLKWQGIVAPTQNHIDNRILEDHMSIYKFILDTDGETILYYAKATGVYPKSISRASFSEIATNGELKISVGFKMSGWFEDMNPSILYDFNKLVGNWVGTDGTNTSFNAKGDELPIYDHEIDAVSGENIDYFYVDKVSSTGKNEVINKDGYTKYYLVGCQKSNREDDER